MSDLFGWFQSYLNLSKITAVTVPGMVIAFALVLVLGPIPCRDDVKNCPYCTDSVKPASAAAATATVETPMAKFQMGGAKDKTAVSTDDSHTLVIDWNDDQYKLTQPDPKKGEAVALSGPTATFISTSGPDVSDIASYSWKVDGQAICGAPEKPTAPQKPSTTKPSPATKKSGPADDPSVLPEDKVPGTPGSPCGQFMSHRFTQPGNYVITLTVTNKDGKSASTAGLVAVLPARPETPKKPPPTLPSADFNSCFQRKLVNGHCSETASPYPDKFDIEYNERWPRYFDSTAKADPGKNVYVWKEDGYPICYTANCLISFNTSDGRANPTGSWVISLDVISKADKTRKSSGSQIIERDPIPPLSVHPASLNFLTGNKGRLLNAKQTLALTVSPATKITAVAISSAGNDKDLFHVSLPSDMEQGRHPLPAKANQKPYEITVTYSPYPGIVRYLAPQLWIDHFRAKRSTNATATLSIVAVDSSTGVDRQISILVPLSAAPDPGVALANDAASKQKKLANNTVITSTATFMKSGPDAKGDINRTGVSSDLNTILSQNLGTDDPAVANFSSSCKGLPVYVVGASRPAPIKAGSSIDASGQSKQGAPQYSGESATSVEDILTISDECQLALTRLDQDIQQKMAAKQAEITQANAELTSLTTSLTNAQTAGSRLVETDLSKKVAAKSAEVATAQAALKSLTQADTYVNALNTQTGATEKSVESQVNSGAASDNSNTVSDVFTTIQQHFLMFLLFSLIIGQMFDPIQRGLLSYVGPRRNVFTVLNEVYGNDRGDGEFRYGDRRLPPWTSRTTYLPDLRDPRTTAQATSWKRKADERGLRYSVADFVFRRNMNIYDQNYAIGAQYISQSEFNNIYNEFFRESQITTGLILPLLILSVCIGIRLICCASYAVAGGSAWWAVGSVLGAIYLAVVVSLLALAFAARMGSKRYWEVVRDALRIGFLALSYRKDPKGKDILARWQTLNDTRKKLDDKREWLADHAEWLHTERKQLDEESTKLKPEKKNVLAHQSRDFERALNKLNECLRQIPSGTSMPDSKLKELHKKSDALGAEARNLLEACRQACESDTMPTDCDALFSDIRDAYVRALKTYSARFQSSRRQGDSQPDSEKETDKPKSKEDKKGDDGDGSIFADGLKLIDECIRMADRKTKDAADDESDRQRRKIYNKRRNHYFHVNLDYRTQWKKYQDARQEFKQLRAQLIADQKDYEQKQGDNASLGDWFHWAWEEPFIKGMAVLMIPALVLIYANLEIVNAESLPIIALPSLFLAPLWVAGLDRLHKYYSELQARIAGNILRQQQTSIQRLVDVVTNSDSRNDLIKNLDTAISEKSTLANFLRGAGGKKTTATEASAAGQDTRTLGLEPLSMNPDDDDTALDLGTISGDAL